MLTVSPGAEEALCQPWSRPEQRGQPPCLFHGGDSRIPFQEPRVPHQPPARLRSPSRAACRGADFEQISALFISFSVVLNVTSER